MVLAYAILQSAAVGRTITVRPGSAIPDLRTALRFAQSHDEILITAGTYYDTNIVIDIPVVIRGEGHPRLNGMRAGSILLVRSDSVALRGLTLEETGHSNVDDRAAVKCLSARLVLIENLRLEDTFFGIYFSKSARCVVRNCRIVGRALRESMSGNGIHSWYSDSLRIEGNIVERHRDGIYLEFTRHSLVIGNTSRGNLRYGLHFMFSDNDTYVENTFSQNGSGVAVMYTRHVAMRRNTFRDNWGSASYGLLLKDIYDSVIEENLFERNTAGIYAEGGARLTVSCNRFLSNGWAIRLMANCTDNLFSGNEFLMNTFDVSTNSTRSFSTFRGNYWDGYRGYDLDRNGTGDVPYRPAKIFSTIVERNPPSVILLNSVFISLLDLAERVFPSVTPETLRDDQPMMTPVACAARAGRTRK